MNHRLFDDYLKITLNICLLLTLAKCDLRQCFSKCGPILATLESLEYWVEMQTLSLQPRFTESEILNLSNLF